MSMLGDYKSYKKYAPEYSGWKAARDTAEAKREEYLRLNPDEVHFHDIQKSKALLRAIDIMDEYSQKRAEDMEVATESVISMGMEFATTVGGGIGFLVSRTKPFREFIAKFIKDKKNTNIAATIAGLAGGILVGTIAAFPLNAWAARAEVKASRKGRFEAMRKELNDPKTFAALTLEQEQELNKNLALLSMQKKKKNPIKSLKENFNTVKEMVTDSDTYLMNKLYFEKRLMEDEELWDNELSSKEIENAKHDQQLLTKLVEKIDIASQDYAENAELATSTLVTVMFAFGALFSLGYEKLAQKMKWKASAIPSILGMTAALGTSIFAAQIQKEAARVGRFKMKQDLMKNPEKLVYVDDEKTKEITDVKINQYKKTNMIKFLKEAWKNNSEYNKWKKSVGNNEKNISKAMENIELTEEQMSDAKRIQHNTFKTFNRVDENSQKYSESIEALGQAIQYPISMICSMLGASIGIKFLTKSFNAKTSAEQISGFMKYMTAIIISTLPSIGINAYITKEQKKASRVADMIAINELSDYRNFADYSRLKS